MYPAIGFGTIDDLPDTITSSAESLSKLDSPIEFALPNGSGNFTMYYGTYTSPLESEGVGLFNNQWAFKVDGGSLAGVTRDCLINEICFSEQDPDWFCDNFADTYTLTAYDQNGLVESVVVTRVSLCLWTGVNSFGNVSGIEYLEDGSAWAASFLLDNAIIDGAKFGFQNTPVGDYGNIPGTIALTVS